MANTEVYDPTRDLAVLVHAAVRQGFWTPAPRGAVDRLARELGIGDFTMASAVEAGLREQLARAGRRQAALDNVAYLASLPEKVLREALLVFRYEQPDRAQLLHDLLTGAAVPQLREAASG